ETSWLGGMLTSAGVSAIDGNYKLQSGLWKEFRDHLVDLYGSDDSLKTGWVSNTVYQPQQGEIIIRKMVDHEGITVLYNTRLTEATVDGNRITSLEFVDKSGAEYLIEAGVYIEATEMGDLIRLSNIPHRFGMESTEDSGESLKLEQEKRWTQDITYAVILKYGKNQTPEPPDYDPSEFKNLLNSADGSVSPEDMINYGRLPGDRFMLNWPRGGNDFYLDEEAYYKPETRVHYWEQAKNVTRRLIYHINRTLDLPEMEIDRNQYPTDDGFPLIPYIREALRIRGREFLILDDLIDPYKNGNRKLFRDAIAVGDYPVDHHRLKNPNPMDIKFPEIPSFSIPFGSLVTEDLKNFMAIEKSISVSSLVNGSSRLQPVVMSLGQAAGAAAALSVKSNTDPFDLKIHQIQEILLKEKAYILPYMDILSGTLEFYTSQYAGINDKMRGYGKAVAWANETRFFPEREIDNDTWFFLTGLDKPAKLTKSILMESLCRLYSFPTFGDIKELIHQLNKSEWIEREISDFLMQKQPLDRKYLSVLITAFEKINRKDK
ncbi:MAG: FAD-dependent oxidoreductase, partial [Spirochaetaceae bacterium]|nr:FAD-dependent oxidoreductase [Spirochaetaceae bacterium]